MDRYWLCYCWDSRTKYFNAFDYNKEIEETVISLQTEERKYWPVSVQRMLLI